ncbi:MAG: hypothetical protein EU547_04750 [Promethearchaeota archaeon]|nr:MAG: hypothetical protein EU547_04750 [Candidatus Lokiarchaeota archaeon]
MPNWFVHMDWCQKAGIPKKIAEFVNRSIDYGSDWIVNKTPGDLNIDEGPFYQQLVYFYNKDNERKVYVKACYLHHLLDFFKETNVDVYQLDLVFKKFLNQKAVINIIDLNGNKVNFEGIIDNLFQLLRNNKKELLVDLFG